MSFDTKQKSGFTAHGHSIHEEQMAEQQRKRAQSRQHPEPKNVKDVGNLDSPIEDNEQQNKQQEASDNITKEESAEFIALKDMLDKLKRALAEMDNENKRVVKQCEDKISFGLQSFVKDLSEVVDVLFMAVGSVKSSSTEAEITSNPKLKSLLDGIVMTQSSLLKVLEKNGVQRIDPLGQMFDSKLHQAISMSPDKSPNGTILNVIKAGYVLNGRLIAPAVVIVSSGLAK